MNGWRSKDDLDLTSEDLAEMLDEGEPLAQGLPQGVALLTAVPSYGAPFVPLPVPTPIGFTVSAPAAV